MKEFKVGDKVWIFDKEKCKEPVRAIVMGMVGNDHNDHNDVECQLIGRTTIVKKEIVYHRPADFQEICDRILDKICYHDVCAGDYSRIQDDFEEKYPDLKGD